jgi:hypothetical protein
LNNRSGITAKLESEVTYCILIGSFSLYKLTPVPPVLFNMGNRATKRQLSEDVEDGKRARLNVDDGDADGAQLTAYIAEQREYVDKDRSQHKASCESLRKEWDARLKEQQAKPTLRVAPTVANVEKQVPVPQEQPEMADNISEHSVIVISDDDSIGAEELEYFIQLADEDW